MKKPGLTARAQGHVNPRNRGKLEEPPKFNSGYWFQQPQNITFKTLTMVHSTFNNKRL